MRQRNIVDIPGMLQFLVAENSSAIASSPNALTAVLSPAVEGFVRFLKSHVCGKFDVAVSYNAVFREWRRRRILTRNHQQFGSDHAPTVGWGARL